MTRVKWKVYCASKWLMYGCTGVKDNLQSGLDLVVFLRILFKTFSPLANCLHFIYDKRPDQVLSCIVVGRRMTSRGVRPNDNTSVTYYHIGLSRLTVSSHGIHYNQQGQCLIFIVRIYCGNNDTYSSLPYLAVDSRHVLAIIPAITKWVISR